MEFIFFSGVGIAFPLESLLNPFLYSAVHLYTVNRKYNNTIEHRMCRKRLFIGSEVRNIVYPLHSGWTRISANGRQARRLQNTVC